MLDVRLTIGGRSRKIGGVPLANESDDVRGKRARKTSRRSPTRMYFPRATARLLGTHGRGKHDLVGLRVCSASGAEVNQTPLRRELELLLYPSFVTDQRRLAVISLPGRRLD